MGGVVPITTVVTSVLDCRDKVLRSLGRLPPFSPVLNRVLASISGEDFSFSAVADLIEKDTVLAGNVLKIVNSALYGRRGTVNSVRHAVSLLGINKLRNAVLSLSIARMWNSVKTPPGWSMARFNLHSVAVGILCDQIAQYNDVEYPEGAFVAGLLHDVGHLLIAVAAPSEYIALEKLYALGGRTWCECEMEILGFTHADISAEALDSWNLPEPIRHAVEGHHSFETGAGRANNGEIPLSALLCAADEYVRFCGTAIHPNYSASDEPSPARFLDMAGDRVDAVVNAWKAEVAAVNSYF